MKRVIRAATDPKIDALLKEIKAQAAQADYNMTVKSTNPVTLIFKNDYNDPEIYVDALSFTDEAGNPANTLAPVVRFPSYEFGESDDANPGYLRGLLEDWADRVGGFIEYLTSLQF